MEKTATGLCNFRGFLLLACISALVLWAAPSATFAQKGMGGESGGGIGGGRPGGSGKGSREKKERPKRNEQEPVDPVQSREKLEKSLVMAFTEGTASPPFLASQFDQASTQPNPASAQSRKRLAEALGTPLKGNKLEPDPAAALAAPLVAGINAEGIEPDELTSKKDALTQALTDAKLTEEQSQTVLDAFEQVVADQQDEAIQKFAEVLESIQQQGEAGDDLKKSLAESLTALADEQNQPDETSLTKLSEQLTKATDAAQLTNKEKAQLASDVRALFTKPTAPPAEFNATLNQVRNTLKAGLAKPADIQAVATTLQSIRKSLAEGEAKPAEPPATAPAESEEK